MLIAVDALGNPPTYPKDGTYADLLVWHLFVWQTRPEGSRSVRGTKPWDIEEFKLVVIGGSSDLNGSENRRKTFESWTGKNLKLCPLRGRNEHISELLFGTNVDFSLWKGDLEDSIKRSSPKPNNVLNIDKNKCLEALVVAGYLGVQVTASVMSSTPPGHFGTNAREGLPRSDQLVPQPSHHKPEIRSGLEFQLQRELAERLKIEQLANVHRSALLFAAEAERANNAGRYDVGMRFALCGWLATAQLNEGCLDQVRAELERGARGIRRIFSASGAVLHAYYKSSTGNGLIISDDTSVYAQPLPSGERINIGKFDDWFAIFPDNSHFVCHENAKPELHCIKDILGEIDITYIFPNYSRHGLFQFHRNGGHHYFVELSSDKSVLLHNNEYFSKIWNIKNEIKCVLEITSSSHGCWATLSPDGSLFYSNRREGRIAIWQTSSLDIVCDLNRLLSHHSNPVQAYFSYSGDYINLCYFRISSYKVSIADFSFSILPYRSDINYSQDGGISFCYDSSGLILRNEISGCIINLGEFLSIKAHHAISSNNEIIFAMLDKGIIWRKISGDSSDIPVVFKDFRASRVYCSHPGKFAYCYLEDKSTGKRIDGVGVFDVETGKEILLSLSSTNIAVSDCDKLIAVKWAPSHPYDDNGTILFYDQSGEIVEKIDSGRIYSGFEFIDGGRFLALYSKKYSFSSEIKEKKQLDEIEILDTNFAAFEETDDLVKFICDVKLVGKEEFVESDFCDTHYNNVTFDVVRQCRALVQRQRMS